MSRGAGGVHGIIDSAVISAKCSNAPFPSELILITSDWPPMIRITSDWSMTKGHDPFPFLFTRRFVLRGFSFRVVRVRVRVCVCVCKVGITRGER